MYMRGDMRVLFLTESIRKLGKLIRKGQTDHLTIGPALASIFGRTAAFADSFVNLPLASAMCEKYPKDHCAYCLRMPCECELGIRPGITHAHVSEEQIQWTTNQWCEHIGHVYGPNNRIRGIAVAHGRLNEELGEVISAQILDGHNQRLTLTDVRRNISLEFADLFAWIFTIADLSGVDLDKSLTARYPGYHKRCGKCPCNCGPFYLTCINSEGGDSDYTQ
jgi:NTP pyrophosphatase (non-canonical NTP hydrolase)